MRLAFGFFSGLSWFVSSLQKGFSWGKPQVCRRVSSSVCFCLIDSSVIGNRNCPEYKSADSIAVKSELKIRQF